MKNETNYLVKLFLSTDKRIIEDDNFDVAIIAREAISQIELLTALNFIAFKLNDKRPNPGTNDCIEFINSHVMNKYAIDKNLNFLILIETGFKIDIKTMRDFVNSPKFGFASLWLFGYYLNGKLEPYVIPVFLDLME